jgi:hypothetical protein
VLAANSHLAVLEDQGYIVVGRHSAKLREIGKYLAQNTMY